MPSGFTTLWTNDTCRRLAQLGQVGAPLSVLYGGPHRSEPSFLRAGVRPGDTIYPIRVERGAMYVLARLRVRRVASLADYLAQDGAPGAGVEDSAQTDQAFERYLQRHPEQRPLAPTCTEEVVVGDEGTPVRLDVAVPPELLAQLRYRSQRRERGIAQIRGGKLASTVGVHGIFRLSDESAAALAALLAAPGEPQGS